MKMVFIIPDMSWLYDYKSQFSLGILCLATILKRESWDVEIFDTNANDIKNLPKADVYGISILYNTYESAIEISKYVRKKYPCSIIICGGIYPTTSPEKFTTHFDCVFRGEAENTLKEFCDNFSVGDMYKQIYHETGQVDISDIIPDRSIVDESYIRTGSMFLDDESASTGGSTHLMFSRGCPGSCTFCCSPFFYKRRVRFRPVKSIIKEIKDIINTYSIRQFKIQDDTFTLKPSFLKELTGELKKLNIHYRCLTRADAIDDNVVQMLYDSGCREIALGIECADNEVLKLLKKNETVEDISQAITIIKKYPIKIRSFFIVGLPFDTKERMQKNIDFIEDNKLDHATISNLIPFPGTELYDKKEKFGITDIQEHTCMNVDSGIPFSPNIKCEHMTEEEHIEIMKIFYNYMVKRGFTK